MNLPASYRALLSAAALYVLAACSPFQPSGPTPTPAPTPAPISNLECRVNSVDELAATSPAANLPLIGNPGDLRRVVKRVGSYVAAACNDGTQREFPVYGNAPVAPGEMWQVVVYAAGPDAGQLAKPPQKVEPTPQPSGTAPPSATAPSKK